MRPSGFLVQVVDGTSEETHRVIRDDGTKRTWRIGSAGDWCVEATGVAPVHLLMAFRNGELVVRTHGERDAWLNGRTLGDAWVEVSMFAHLTFGAARLSISPQSDAREERFGEQMKTSCSDLSDALRMERRRHAQNQASLTGEATVVPPMGKDVSDASWEPDLEETMVPSDAQPFDPYRTMVVDPSKAMELSKESATETVRRSGRTSASSERTFFKPDAFVHPSPKGNVRHQADMVTKTSLHSAPTRQHTDMHELLALEAESLAGNIETRAPRASMPSVGSSSSAEDASRLQRATSVTHVTSAPAATSMPPVPSLPTLPPPRAMSAGRSSPPPSLPNASLGERFAAGRLPSTPSQPMRQGEAASYPPSPPLLPMQGNTPLGGALPAGRFPSSPVHGNASLGEGFAAGRLPSLPSQSPPPVQGNAPLGGALPAGRSSPPPSLPPVQGNAPLGEGFAAGRLPLPSSPSQPMRQGEAVSYPSPSPPLLPMQGNAPLGGALPAGRSPSSPVQGNAPLVEGFAAGRLPLPSSPSQPMRQGEVASYPSPSVIVVPSSPRRPPPSVIVVRSESPAVGAPSPPSLTALSRVVPSVDPSAAQPPTLASERLASRLPEAVVRNEQAARPSALVQAPQRSSSLPPVSRTVMSRIEPSVGGPIVSHGMTGGANGARSKDPLPSPRGALPVAAVGAYQPSTNVAHGQWQAYQPMGSPVSRAVLSQGSSGIPTMAIPNIPVAQNPSSSGKASPSANAHPRQLREKALDVWRNASLVGKVTAVAFLPITMLSVVFLLQSQAQSSTPTSFVDAPMAAASSSSLPRVAGAPSETAPMPSSGAMPFASASVGIVATPSPRASEKTDRGAAPVERARPNSVGSVSHPLRKTVERAALDAAAEGAYASAAEQYVELAAQHPDNQAFREAARILQAKATTTSVLRR